jgi:hypothetical protein
MGIAENILGHKQDVQDGLAYLELVEREAPKLIDAMPERLPDDMTHVMVLLKKAMCLAAALRRYPVFDPACLSGLKKQSVRFERADTDVEVWLPTFAWSKIQGHSAGQVRIGVSCLESRLGDAPMSAGFDWPLTQQNRQIVQDLFAKSSRGVNDVLTAVPPVIPAPARSKIDEASGIFDSLHLVWEAQWTLAPVSDPLVIGVIDDQCFLVCEYDATKAEHYVSSEYCRKVTQK